VQLVARQPLELVILVRVQAPEPLLAILCERGKSDLRSKISLGPAFGDGLSRSYECNAELRFAQAEFRVRVLLCCWETAGGVVPHLMAFPAKRDQVDLCVVTEGAAPYQMVHIEIL
jgi:hypothetical protein